MNDFDDYDYSIRYNTCKALIDAWHIKEITDIPYNYHDNTLAKYPIAQEIKLELINENIQIEIRDELLAICELCCITKQLSYIMIKYIIDTLCDQSISLKAFKALFPNLPVTHSFDTTHFPISNGEKWYKYFTQMAK